MVTPLLNGRIASASLRAEPKGASGMKHVLCLTLALLVSVLASGASAQIAGGNIYGTVVDQQSGVLPGVDVTLVSTSIGGQPRQTVTDAQGQFRFLNLDPATYKVTANLAGFNKMERDVIVNTGVNADISFSMGVKSVEETVTVTADSPVVDTKKTGTITTLTAEELQGTPQSKDPWSVLKTVPGVIVDRVNVGGNESGQQSGFVGKESLRRLDVASGRRGDYRHHLGRRLVVVFRFRRLRRNRGEYGRQRPEGPDRRHRHQFRHAPRHEPVQRQREVTRQRLDGVEQPAGLSQSATRASA
jgi:hypothetical protein